MNIGEILSYINRVAPTEYAEKWDNVGLMIGSRGQKVSRILICLDVTSKVIREALDIKAELIVSHHPFLFSKVNRIDLDTLKGEQIAILIKNDISIISAHTNLDFAVGGVNDTLAEVLGLTGCRQLKSYIPEGCDYDIGMGKVGEIPLEVTFEDLVKMIKNNLAIDNLRIIGKQPDKVKHVAVFCGSFDGDLNSVKKQNVDVLITGDMKYHIAQDACEMGLCIIDVGHFASEYVIVERLRSILSKQFEGIELVCSCMEKDPFIYA